MSVQTVANRWAEHGITQSGIKPILNTAFEDLTVTGGPGYCNEDTSKTSKLPGQSASQDTLDKNPYGPTNCNQYATLIKPGVNPLTLRGYSNGDVDYPVSDDPVCLESCDYMSGAGPIRGICSAQCIRSTTFCGLGSTCNNSAPGGLADWMGRPKDGGNGDMTWGSAINNQLSGGKLNDNGYLNPIRLMSEDFMKNGFITQGCECQDGTSRIDGGTFYNWNQAGGGPYTLNTDAGVSSEVWNGQGSCTTWQNNNSADIRKSTCGLDIQKFAQTCKWCKSAVLTKPGVQPDQTYPPHIIVDNRDIFGVGTVSTNPTSCGFKTDENGKYTIDKGDCLGYGANGQPRVSCQHPVIDSYDCPVTTSAKQKIGLFCNVPAGSRLTGDSCAFVQPGDLNYMSVVSGNQTNNYWVSYTNGPSFSVTLSGSLSISRIGNGGDSTGDYTGVITGGRHIAITFPDGMFGSTLMTNLKANSAFNAEIDVTISYAAGVSLSNPQSSIPPPISSIFNTAIPNSNKSTGLGNITYLLRYSSDYPGYTGSYADGNIQIKYANGSLGMSVTGNWSRSSLSDQSLNVITITFPNNYDGPSLVNYINQQFQASSNTRLHNLLATGGSGPQKSYNDTYYYGFGQGGDPKNGGTWYPGNCNVRLNGTIFQGPWTPSTQNTEAPWIGMQGIKCDYAPNKGYCQPLFYDPDSTGDCQICDSDLWDWIPGGWEAVVDSSSNLHNLALTAYIPKFQNLKANDAHTCDQSNGGLGSTTLSVPYCGKDNGNNRCTAVCGQNCVKMTWDTALSGNATVVDRLIPETGGINNTTMPGDSCPDMLCERNPVLTLRGTSSQENIKLVTNWMDGIFDLTTLHGRETNIENPIVPDLRAYGQPDELAKRTIKAMRCCLGVGPGFKSSDGGPNGTPKTGAEKDPYGGLEMWDLHDCPPGVMCPSSDTCKSLFKSVLDGSNEHVDFSLEDFGSSSYPNGFSLDSNTTSNTSESVLLKAGYYAKAYCEMMSGGSQKNLSTSMGLDDEINTLCRKAMYNYCATPVKVDVINDTNYWNAPVGATGPPSDNAKYSKTEYELPLKIFTQGCNLWFKNQLQNVMPSDYGTRDMLLGSACQQLQVDRWYNPVGPDQSPLLQAFVTKDGKIKDKSGYTFDLSYVGSASATSGNGSIPSLLANTCNCFLQGSKCQSNGSSNCSYQYCGAGLNTEVKIDFGNPTPILNPLNKPVDLSPYTSKIGSDGKAIGDSSWTKYQDITAPSWTTGLDTTNFTCAQGNASQGMVNSGNEAGGTSNCYTGCNYINEYDVCWNASPTNRKYSGELLGGKTEWNCDFTEKFDNCNPSKGTSYSCFGDCEHNSAMKDGSTFPSCGTQTWFDNTLNLNPGEIKVKENRSSGRSDIMDTPYWQNFYSGASEQVSSAIIPNIGSVYNPSRAILASDSICGSPDSIKPYNTGFTSQNNCIISQSVSVNNQGIITGSVGVSQLGSCNVSNIFQGHNQHDFLTYMGDTNCTGQSTTCWDNSKFCLTDGSTANKDNISTGENCMACGNSNLALVDAPTKTNTCCLDPSLGKNDKTYQNANSNILTAVTLGDKPVVSYFCNSETCPTGSTDLATLQSACGSGDGSFTCTRATDQATCEGCDYCRWQPVYNKAGGSLVDTGSKHCVAVCPTAPQNGWVNGGTPTPTPTPTPTSGPTSGPTFGPTLAPTASNLSTTDIVLIVFGVIILLVFLVNLGIVFPPRGKSNGVGTVKGRSFGIKGKRGFGSLTLKRKFKLKSNGFEFKSY
jgi:hypothetical protein